VVAFNAAQSSAALPRVDVFAQHKRAHRQTAVTHSVYRRLQHIEDKAVHTYVASYLDGRDVLLMAAD
jgi:hypothetical protein